MERSAELKLFESYLAPVLKTAYGTAYYLTHSREEAEDLVQEASLHAFRAFATFQPGTNFKAWFLRILTNLFLNQCRKKRRSPDLVLWEGAVDAYLSDRVGDPQLVSQATDPSRELMRKLDQQAILDAVAALPEEYRAVCTLYFLDELSYQEISDILECPIGTVRSRLHRGRRALQYALKSLTEYGGEEESGEREAAAPESRKRSLSGGLSFAPAL